MMAREGLGLTSHPSHFTIRISVRRDHAIGKLNVERDLQRDITHQWDSSSLEGGSSPISLFYKWR